MNQGSLPTRVLGRTGLSVTALGYGAMALDRDRMAPRGLSVPDAQAGEVLNAVLDAGINFIDTAPDYGTSEDLIGQFIAHRRAEYFLASKCGCPVAPAAMARGGHVYTPENIRAGVEQSLARMGTDYLDAVQFHGSPSASEEADAIATLIDLKKEGKVRFIGASATLPRLTHLIELGVLDVFQIPYSAVQREHEDAISAAAVAGAGTIIRGGVARGAPADDKEWAQRLPDNTAGDLQDIWESANLDDLLDGASRIEFILRFTLSHPDMHTTIVGTGKVEHLRQNVDAALKGPLPPDVYAEAKRRLRPPPPLPTA
jgi:aryl-alcohol dehydrogenase-like predicted oxidoreductase